MGSENATVDALLQENAEYTIAECVKRAAECLNEYIRKAKAQGLSVDVSTNMFLSVSDADPVTVRVGKMIYL